ncbi:MAG: ECF transporter S component [Treponema sp.]
MNFRFSSKNRERVLFFVLSIVCGLLDYVISDFVAWINNLPLFCDTIFIMALSFFAGPWWGILAGFFCHFIAAFTAGWYKIHFLQNERSKFKIFIKLFFLSILLCLLMSISGGIIGYFLLNIESYRFATSQTDFLSFLWRDDLKSELLLQIVVRIPVNIADRFICVFAAWGVYLLAGILWKGEKRVL